MKNIATVLCCLLASIAFVDCSNVELGYTERMQKAKNLSRVINYIIKDSGYDIMARPNDGGEPVDVTVELKIVSFGEFLEARMEYSMDIYFRQWWVDPRFKHNVDRTFNIAGDATKLFWTPDTYFVNAKLSVYHFITRENMRIMIWPDGRIYFSTRITLTVQCSMDFRLYPMDTQRCPLVIESYAHTVEDIRYEWKSGKKGDGIEVVSERIAQFELLEVKKDSGAQSNSKGSFSSVKAWFSFKRRTTYFFYQSFMPTIFLVIISWCQFWISAEAVPARVSLSVTTVLAILFLSSTINENMPKVSYMKAIDYFLSVSFLFIFCTLLEYVIVLNTEPSNRRKEKKDTDDGHMNGHAFRERRGDQDLENMNVVITIMDRNGTNCTERHKHGKHFVAEGDTRTLYNSDGSYHRVDKWSRVCFPLTYALFLIGYWLYYSYVYNAL
ncbi:gamma-aminobutyric acid receptor subunit beta-3 [Exaiptasia diaphana]|uniref:Gamma-aminobutyric acid receptor subunit beta n=1 Tax=Exaiptasia diaphana TaxID=2652724 RepID=A0A913X3C6_EXADI|nr:gamma-aminobutyric acid receptor subunit beta-3 [Exaiptasia diaphana]XP_020898208.1 gamma-aminobutyric acid receptor subunit beta-3 [Exaiptasia diaphana]KXJ15703.1 Gamma-aminobutyric acid receptor subunit beta-1 [Exaiptasia diaphana]